MSKTGVSLNLKLVVQLLLVVVLLPFLPLLISWNWGWWQAWVFAGISFFGFVISRALVARIYPDLVAERWRLLDHENVARWDRYLAPAAALGGGLISLVAGIDARLSGSPGFGLPLELLALGCILLSYSAGTWALVTNRFFSGVVRLQAERGHYVVTAGPYRYLRHPGYAVAILNYLAIPFLLDSLWALAPAVLVSALLVYRTALEDRFLQEKLAGYRAYAAETRYRLIPGVW